MPCRPHSASARTERSAYAGEQGHATEEIFHGTPSILGYAFVIAFVAGFGFFVLSFVVLGILPARQLQAEIDRTAPRSMQPLTASEAHGRVVYGREGCAYCHTEQVRVIARMSCDSVLPPPHGRRSMTIRICGERGASDRISPESMACAPMTGTLRISSIRAPPFPIRSCLLTLGCSTALPRTEPGWFGSGRLPAIAGAGAGTGWRLRQ